MKFLYGYFNEISGESIVGLADKYGTYIGEAKVHPDDKKNASKFTGCSIAENRALIKLLKKRLQREKIRLKTIENLYKDVSINCSDLIKENPKLEKRFKIQIKNSNNTIKDIQKFIYDLNFEIFNRIKIREEILDKKKLR